jgi:hypothetical protein
LRFMVESPAQPGRLRTLIHPGTIARGHVTALGSVARLCLSIERNESEAAQLILDLIGPVAGPPVEMS